MATDVIMPQMGESVVEGTVGRWLKQEGDTVEEYEPLLEVETDKVTSEVTAPARGTILKIYVGEGRFVHAPSSGGTVRLDQLDGHYWRDHYSGARRVLP